ncbi:hypothetical protein [Clostridium ganghwense]|uniref:Uncharacterized protein n=1 Tax=Clostridium ganghwense TaxID=312089 RepID=A0ABT4CU30_9CLOT|nr:hypothetical protein [Clostridium ganghwense]MCY6372567.1 hypothetical protein [Clostridium ganghwense]
MDKETKELLLEIESEIKNIDNRLKQIEMKASNGNYVYSEQNEKYKGNE